MIAPFDTSALMFLLGTAVLCWSIICVAGAMWYTSRQRDHDLAEALASFSALLSELGRARRAGNG